jgi:transposase
VGRLELSDLYWLADEQMERLEPYFPKSRKPRVDDRRVLSGIIFVNRNRAQDSDARCHSHLLALISES